MFINGEPVKKFGTILILLWITSNISYSVEIFYPINSLTYNVPLDTNIVFNSPRPLIKSQTTEIGSYKSWGFNLILSNNGFGFGLFYDKFIAEDLSLFANLYMSGARNTDEFEYYDPNTGRLFVPGKINRLYMFPLTFGMNKFVFTKALNSNFFPYINFGVGPTFIIATPYEKEFFTSFGYTHLYIRFGGFVGGGINIPTTSNSYLGFSIRYYWIPFGGNGLESIKDLPIKDFGGLFLGLNIGINI